MSWDLCLGGPGCKGVGQWALGLGGCLNKRCRCSGLGLGRVSYKGVAGARLRWVGAQYRCCGLGVSYKGLVG